MSEVNIGTRETWCLDKEFREAQRLFHTQQVEEQVLPFWAKSFDETYGGVYTCYSNKGDTLISQDKYVWSQGRMLWLLSSLLMMHESAQVNLGSYASFYRSMADKLYLFLHEHALLPEGVGVTSFLLDRYGGAKEQVSSKGFYTSFYPDCFLIMGYAKYAMVQNNHSIALEAQHVLKRLLRFLEKGDIRTEPYPLPTGFSTQAVPMILCNTLKELSDCFALFDQAEQKKFLLDAQKQAITILNLFYDDQRMRLKEIIPSKGYERSLFARHYNPGHAIECMWFCLDCLDDPVLVERMSGIVLTSLSLAWDEE